MKLIMFLWHSQLLSRSQSGFFFTILQSEFKFLRTGKKNKKQKQNQKIEERKRKRKKMNER